MDEFVVAVFIRHEHKTKHSYSQSFILHQIYSVEKFNKIFGKTRLKECEMVILDEDFVAELCKINK